MTENTDTQLWPRRFAVDAAEERQRAIQDCHRNVIMLAEQLHKWRCHGDHTDETGFCSWEFEGWESLNGSNFNGVRTVPESRQNYYDKAERVLAFFKTRTEAARAIMFVLTVSPALAMKLIDELTLPDSGCF